MTRRKLFWLNLLTLIFLGNINAQHINEFHYDNVGTDQGEFIEVVIPNPQPVTPSEFKIFIYNGGDNMVQDSRGLQGITPSCEMDSCYYIWSKLSLLQNDTEGIAFVRITNTDTTVFDFISYEGAITALDGPVNGMTSSEVGIQEDSGTPVGWSLQKRSDGTWFAGPETRGSINPIELLSFEGYYREDVNEIILKWSTASELNNHHFEVQRSIDQRTFITISSIPGAGNSQEVLNYEFRDHSRLFGRMYYRLKQVDYGGSYSYSPLIAVVITEQLGLNEIMPFYSHGELRFAESTNRHGVEVSLYNTVGQLLFHRQNVHTEEEVPVYLPASGIVFFHLRSQGQEHSGRLFVAGR